MDMQTIKAALSDLEETLDLTSVIICLADTTEIRLAKCAETGERFWSFPINV
ncbi:hypothetical protein SAMN05444004_10893 [Jannaschia faecimaris]|uniref:Uncharacterized protein n=1 Tax=Jannaschia faecimaris TaxID=1244108 RepID=A0A1H3RF65_9RHOB|nr:hypothetical protein [Jannaschia faecimaris]SDZ24270.1 hypothetical protein SAMN05444004_10893 [Jannaschia faecimaris]